MSIMTKRTSLNILALIGLAPYVLTATLSAQEAAQETAQPDILLIMPDQWRGDALSILKCSGSSTPQLVVPTNL